MGWLEDGRFKVEVISVCVSYNIIMLQYYMLDDNTVTHIHGIYMYTWNVYVIHIHIHV